MSGRAVNVGTRSSRPLVVVILLATVCLLVFGAAAALIFTPSPTDPPKRWSPPVPGPLPAAVADREPLPFCGVAQGSNAEFVDRCMQQAIESHQAAEVGVIDDSGSGQRVSIVRSLADGSAEIFIHGTLETDGYDGWLLMRCTALEVEYAPQDYVIHDGCGPTERI